MLASFSSTKCLQAYLQGTSSSSSSSSTPMPLSTKRWGNVPQSPVTVVVPLTFRLTLEKMPPFFAASRAVLVKSPSVCFPMKDRSSNVDLLAWKQTETEVSLHYIKHGHTSLKICSLRLSNQGHSRFSSFLIRYSSVTCGNGHSRRTTLVPPRSLVGVPAVPACWPPWLACWPH